MRNKISIAALLSLTMVFSCVDEFHVGNSFLEKAPGVDVNVDTVFAKGESAKYFLWNLYNQISCPFYDKDQLNSTPIEALSDIFHAYSSWSGAYMWYYPGNLTEDSQSDSPGPGIEDKFAFSTGRGGNGGGSTRPGIWDALRKGWIFVENIDKVPDLTETEKSRLRGEAYVIMATRYLDGLKNFGGLPIVDHAYQTGESVNGGRATVAQTVEFIDGLLQKAIDEPGFSWILPDVDNEAGRVTKASAMALRAKLYLFAASPLFNDSEPYMQFTRTEENQDIEAVWYGGYHPELWEKCRQACEDFFRVNKDNGDYYGLVEPDTEDEDGYSKAFRAAYWFRGNREKLIEVHSTYFMEEWGDQHYGIGNVAHQGHLNPTVEYMEMFPMADGRNYPYLDQGVYNTDNPQNVDIFAGRDPRLYETMLVNRPKLREDYMGMSSVSIWKGGDVDNNSNVNNWKIRFNTGMALFKWIRDFWKMTSDPVSYSYMRMADMYLIYAEALAETGDLQGACDQVNIVRARVGLGKIEKMNPQLNLTSNKANLISEILRERACEFGMEDERLYDIIRRKCIDKFTSPLHELVIWRKTADGGKDTRTDTAWKNGEPWPDFIYERRVITEGARRWWEPGFWTNKWLLSPLTRDEINKEYGLFQNPGW